MIIVYNFRIFILSARILIPQKDKNNRYLLDFSAQKCKFMPKNASNYKKNITFATPLYTK